MAFSSGQRPRSWLRSFQLCVALLSAATAGAADDAEKAATHYPTVVLETSLGAITLELWPDRAPQTVRDFLHLVDDGFYQGLVFHRVIPGFMIQTGGFDRDLTYRKAPRTVPNESMNGLKNVRGTLAMARHSDPNSAGAQFFINMNDNTHLDFQPGRPGYSVFGRVVSGYEIAEDIELTDTATVNGMRDVPLEPIVIAAARRVNNR